MNSSVCNHEAARIAALDQYQILDSAPEQVFDDLAFLAAQICDTPIALINLLDANRQWFKAKIGLDIQQIPMNIGFCRRCVQQRETLIIPDTLADEAYATDAVVTSAPYARFYAGVPLIIPGGEAIGTISIVDHIPRQITTKQVEALQAISRLIVTQLEVRRNSIEDTTANQRAKLQICEQTALLDIATDAIIVRDLSHNILVWNKSAENIYGFSAAEAIGENAMELLENQSIAKELEIYRDVLKYGSWQGELQRNRKSGEKILVNSRWSLFCDEDLQPKSILIVDTDITQRQELQKQFLRAQRVEKIGTLAGGIVHDLNNVLSPILMSVHLLQRQCGDRQTEQILSIIDNNTKHGINLVKQMLSFVQGIGGDISEQPTALQHTVIQVKDLILEMQQIVQQTFPKSISLSTEIPPDLWQIYGNSTQFHQILMNLCLNARDAMPEGGRLSISASNIFIDENYAKMSLDAQVGDYIVLTVTDTGLGINPKILDKIFAPFFTTKEIGQGTGLGLATVIAIVKEHDGLITVSSSVGQGTKFQVYLPAITA
ncbi:MULTISPECIES: ATP-binding protein [Cyanophyceae]|uniref:ATP-binding protein n=1 Tax=Cyanophyceae TaxID=3028117 RepID=UPI00232ECCBA|nr:MULTISPECIES: ATP-binding protein [Cyanophyceae]MDB9355131.1 ATP-binding protein [Nodularia spumigena CS-587/03]MDB9340510.1 ATP-binding protein [Nodularia spumigena CS-589/07]MDB9400007.1 ATP-binding protein [Microcystis aeruginosa CS-567/02-A1]MDB9499889.1 ATP-binding protein [Nodularia spumigena CS-336/02]MDB9531441.1 ATP-binding protein [Nodularia spumigena CS-1038]